MPISCCVTINLLFCPAFGHGVVACSYRRRPASLDASFGGGGIRAMSGLPAGIAVAARAALHALAVGPAMEGQTTDARQSGENARQVATIMEEYLIERLRWQRSEFTSRNIAARLRAAGCGDVLAGKAAGLLHACDATRFAPGGSNGNDLFAALANLIEALEKEWLERSR